jgi:hypothetical protein
MIGTLSDRLQQMRDETEQRLALSLLVLRASLEVNQQGQRVAMELEDLADRTRFVAALSLPLTRTRRQAWPREGSTGPGVAVVSGTNGTCPVSRAAGLRLGKE